MWFFFSPNIIYGPDALDFFENISGKKCFIITDKILENLGYLKILTEKLDKFEKTYETFNEVLPDPREEGVLKARELCLNYKPDIIIALGGGSVMDTAKTVWALYEFPELELDDIHAFRSDLYEMGKRAKLVAVPTTSGTGAETTYVTVISRYEEDIWKKYLYLHRGLIPTYAIVDPIFPKGMPPQLTVDTAFDALAHSIEGLGTLWRNEFSNALALKAIELIFKNLPLAYQDGKNEEARDFLHQAATIAGLAFGNGNVHIGHTMGHSWGALYHVPHGRSVGIIMKYVTQFIMNGPESQEVLKIYAKLSKQMGWVNWDEDDDKAAQMVISKIEELAKKVNFSLNLKDTVKDKVSNEKFESDLDTLLNLCYQDASAVLTPRSPSPDEFKEIYRYAYEGKDIDF
ncbi:MAG: iron-containing alcohol dehydrogenase [Promethearchaeota archaeon]|nr:MAG: iron-containing alcohol dehydrogenase [Candidatus Lokiarchaeota archaeon]